MLSKWWRQRVSWRHLSDETILLHLDGGLDSREDALAARHLRDCWDCRTRKGRLEAAIAAFMDERREDLAGRCWPPPTAERLVAQLHAHEYTGAARARLSPLRLPLRFWWPLAAAATGWAAVAAWTPVRQYVLERVTDTTEIVRPSSRIPAVPSMAPVEAPPKRDPVLAVPRALAPPPLSGLSVQPRPNLDSVELETYLAVHELGLARTGAVEVHRIPGESIVVTGVIDDPERARLLQERLGPLALVRLQLKTLGEEDAVPDLTTPTQVLEPRPSLMEEAVKEYVQRHAPKERAGAEMAEYANSILRLTSAVYGETRSLRVLASVFPARRVRVAAPAQRERLQLVASDHLSELRQATVRLRLLLDRLEPMTTGATAADRSGDLSGADWAAQLERTAARLEYLAGGLFAGLSLEGMDAATAWSRMMESCRALEQWLQEDAALTAAAWLDGGSETAQTVDPMSR